MHSVLAIVLLVGCSSDRPGSDDTAGGDGGAGETAQDCSGGSGWPANQTIVTENTMSALAVVPPEVPPCAPLLIFAHGGNSPGNYVDGRWMDALNTHFVEEAMGRGIVLLVPGVQEGEMIEHTWSLEMDADIDGLIEAARAGADIDRRRTWMVGQSAGGHMTAWMTLYDPTNLSGTAVVSAGLGSYFEYPDPEPARKLPVYVAHDPNDEVVDYQASVHLIEELSAHGHVAELEDWDMPGNGHSWAEGLTPTIIDWLSAH